MNTTQRKKKIHTRTQNDRKGCQGKRKRNAFTRGYDTLRVLACTSERSLRETSRTVGGSEGVGRVMGDTKEEKQKAKVMHGSFPLLLQNLGQTCKGKES